MVYMTLKVGLNDTKMENYVHVRIVSRSVYFGRNQNSAKGLFGIIYLSVFPLHLLFKNQVFIIPFKRMSVLFKQRIYITIYLMLNQCFDKFYAKSHCSSFR